MPTGPEVIYETLTGGAAPCFQFQVDSDLVIVDAKGRQCEPSPQGRVTFDLFLMTTAAEKLVLEKKLEQYPFADSILVIREEGDPTSILRRAILVVYRKSQRPAPAPPDPEVPSRFDRDLP